MVHEGNKASPISLPGANLHAVPGTSGRSIHGLPWGLMWVVGYQAQVLTTWHISNRGSLSYPGWNLNKDTPIYRNMSPAAVSYGGAPTL